MQFTFLCGAVFSDTDVWAVSFKGATVPEKFTTLTLKASIAQVF